MNSNKPYLLRALNEWILDNKLTPHLIVDAHDAGVDVPSEAIQDGKLVLNISPTATRRLELGNEIIAFETRFSGRAHLISLPVDAVLAIYARENGQGMMFARDTEHSPPDPDAPVKSSGPALKVVK